MVRAAFWPLAAFAIALLIAFHPRLGRLFSSFASLVRSFKGPLGVEIDLGKDRAIELSGFFQDAFREIVAKADIQYARLSRAHRLRDLLRAVVGQPLESTLKEIASRNRPTDYRATVYVPDVVFGGYLYQMLDYHPGGGGRGRRFSERYGSIGRAWRLSQSLGQGTAFPATSPDPEDELVRLWGMTRAEAERASRQSLSILCVTLRVEGLAIGLMYIDARQANSFGDDTTAEKVALALESHPCTRELATAVGAALRTLDDAGPFLSLEA